MNPEPRPRSPFLVWLEWGAVVLLVGGVAGYILWKPLDPMGDPRAAQALALVQTHPARSAPSIRQAIDDVMKANRTADRVPSISDWSVRPDAPAGERDSYHVRLVVRLPGDQKHRWIEWEYLWRVRLSPPAVVPLSRPAVEVMP
ncbi:MAG: hypothetical protein EPO02_06855 [Nitrospirae bacterium]|nr:MAG: hypothetical protein EPO02_06855 [Nitrospirota bacterium]